MIVVCDSTCLIGLSRIRHLGILPEIFQEIYVPEAVHHEVVIQGAGRPGAEEVKNAQWIKVQAVSDKLACDFLGLELGKGEAEAITLAKEINADLIILDERIAAEVARLNNLNVMGTLGILRQARRAGLIKEKLLKLAEDLRQAHFWIDDALYEQIIQEEKGKTT